MGVRNMLILTAVAAVWLGAGCEKKEEGGGGPAAAPAGAEASKEAAPAVSAGSAVLDPSKVQNGATISGTITLAGTPPPAGTVDMSQKPECVKVHGEQPVPKDNLIAQGGALADVFVYIKKGLEKYKFDTPSSPAVIDQKGCMYAPHVFGIQLNQDLEVRNSDPFQHNINVKENNPFNLAMTSGQAPVIKPKWFKKEGVPTPFQCDVHSWMHAYACVVKHPYWAVTTTSGKYTIKGLPAGKYTLAVWHEVSPSLKPPSPSEVEIEVKEGETKTQDFGYAIK